MIEIKTPVLPESVVDATIASWHYQVGDYVEVGDNLGDLETDKVSLELPTPKSGIITEILQEIDAVVLTGDTLIKIDDEAQKPANDASSAKTEAPAPAEALVPSATQPPTQVLAQANNTSSPSINPSARKLMAGEGVSREDVVSATDKARVTKESLQHLLSGKKVFAHAKREESRTPLPRIRKRIAERLLAAQHGSALLTTFNEVDLKQIMDLRKQAQERFVEKYGIKLGFMSFFVKASCLALADFPAVNASIDEDDALYRNYMDISVAISTSKGLVVPVIKDAQTLGLAEIEATIIDFALKAREGKLTVDEMSGGTFSITNGGVFGSLLSTPIINPPQSAILGMHKIMERPIAENGQVVIRPMMHLALTYDHRIIDGKEAVSFLIRIKELLENPALLLMNV